MGRVCLTDVAFIHTGEGTDVLAVTNENEPLLLEQGLRGKEMLRNAALRYGLAGNQDSLETLVRDEARRGRRVEAEWGVRSPIPERWRQASLKRVPDVQALKDETAVCGSVAGMTSPVRVGGRPVGEASERWREWTPETGEGQGVVSGGEELRGRDAGPMGRSYRGI